MTEPDVPWSHLHFIGIGGVGMAGIALICRQLGVHITGSDEAASANVTMLREAGAEVHIGHAADHMGTPDVVIFSSAVDATNPEYAAAAERALPLVRRGNFLAQLADIYSQVVAIAGSHGKTTVSAMLTHILYSTDRNPGYLIGGAVADLPAPAAAGTGELLVTEVDESDGTQAALRSSHAIVINVEDDHCWNVGGEESLRQCFRDFAAGAEYLLAYDSEETRNLFSSHANVEFFDDSLVRDDLDLQIPGQHNRLNASLAVHMAARLGVPVDEAAASLQSFHGVDRRLSLRHSGDVDVIEDYAHHPTEVRAAISALRERYGDRKLRIVFQPHRFERVARYAEAFGHELSQADDITVVPTFNAWLDDAHLADPSAIIDAIDSVPVRYRDNDYSELAAEIADSANSTDVIVIMGAGTITKLTGLLVSKLTLVEGSPPADRIVVLMGGPSSEHEVSMTSGKAVAQGLRDAGFNVEEIVLHDAALPDFEPGVRAVFPALHGRFGEDGEVQRLLEKLGLGYVGCDPATSELMLDKGRTKAVLAEHGLPIAAGIVVTDADTPLPADLKLPVLVKPNREGSTIGMAVVHEPDEWRPALTEALKHDTDIVVEAFVRGCEITCGIVMGETLPVIEIVPPGEIFDYDAKYVYAQGKTEYICPPKSLSEEMQRDMQALALAAYHALGARDLLRVDIIVGEDGPVILEGNTIPGFTPTSLVPKAAAAAGMPFPELCAKLVNAAVGRSQSTEH